MATEEGLIHGFATTAPSREPDLPGHGELCALYVDPDQWGRGIGIALVSAARANLFALGFRNAVLWVLEGNVRAERFYRIDQWARAERVGNVNPFTGTNKAGEPCVPSFSERVHAELHGAS